MTTQDITFEIGRVSVDDADGIPFVVPYRCTVRKVDGAFVGAGTALAEFTVQKDAVLIGTLAFPDATAANTPAEAYTPDPDNGGMVLEKGDVIVFATDALTTTAFLTVELDPFARKA
jgi:hypothetical protein